MSTDKDKELERAKKQWDNYFVMHPNERHKPIPETLLDKFAVNTDANPKLNVNEVKKLRKLIEER